MPPKKNTIYKKKDEIMLSRMSAKYLIIVESPSKCKKIEDFLGDDYKCIASKGHLREIDGLRSINTRSNFEVKFSNIKEKEGHIENMKKIISKFSYDKIFLATDDDREGEAISWHICELFDLPVDKTPRILFHEITKPAIVNALKTPTTVNMSLVKAQQARQVLDMVVGYKVSPFLWKYIYSSKDASLSAGRCQTPALRLVYDNEKEKEQSERLIKYKTTASFFSKNLPFTLNTDFESREQVIDFLNKSKSHSHILSLCSPKDATYSSPKPLNTSRLLQVASNVLHISPKQTMMYCQQLYQDGYITYMRTDSTKYSKEFLEKMGKYVVGHWSSDYLGNLDNLENKDTANPHEAIRVTHIEMTSVPSDENKLAALYRLIWRTTVESCMKDAKYKNTTVRITAPDKHEYSHVLEIPVFLGWKIVGNTLSTDGQNEVSGMLLYCQSIEKTGKPVVYNKIESVITVQHKHSHYTEASLIQKLEDLGIGRPSTFSMLVETIKDRGYVLKMDLPGEKIKCSEFKLIGNVLEQIEKEKVFGNEKNKLVIQPTGILTVEFLLKYFDSLFSYEYTKLMEEELDKISAPIHTGSGDIQWYEICKNCYNEIKTLAKPLSTLEKQSYKINDEYVVVFQQHGPVLKKTKEDGTAEFKSIKKSVNLDLDKLKANEYTLEDLIEIQNDNLGLYNDIPVILKKGKYGPYIEWGEQKESIKSIQKPLEDIQLSDVLHLINKDLVPTTPDPNAPRAPTRPNTLNGVIRVIDSNMSVRKGKFGPYIYYKTPTMHKPEFYSLSKFKNGPAVCSLDELKTWIKEMYDVPK